MKSKLTPRILAMTAGVIITLGFTPAPTSAQGTAFTYQGRLNDGANGANGSYDLRFAIYDALTLGTQQGPTLTNAAIAVNNGLFAVTLDFNNQFPGANRWLEIGVRTNGGTGFTTLTPRQKLAAAPYAITAGNLASGTGLAGTYSAVVTLNNTANQFAGGFAGNGANLTNVNAASLGGLASSNLWQLGGNTRTTAGMHFLGTIDDQPVEIKVKGLRALRLEPTSDGPYLTNQVNVIAGSPANFVPNGVHAATIAGGGADSDGFIAYRNSVTADYGTVGGDILNNSASGATVAGGVNNNGNGDLSTISGGDQNWCDGNKATISGGDGNEILGGAEGGTIGGGAYNSILEGGRYGTIPGGANNSATNFAFAAGYSAHALHTGAFVWADFVPVSFSSTGTNQFLIRASGGVGIGKNNPATALDVNGTVTATGFSGSGSALTGLSAGQLNGIIPGGALAGTYSSAVTLNNAANSFTGNGAGLTSVNAATLDGFDSVNFWKTTGNAGTIPGANFIGTTDNQPLLIRGRFVGIGRTNAITAAEYFGVEAPVAGNLFGGMYVNTTNAASKPFYGYAQAGAYTAYHYVDGADGNKWKLYLNGDRLVVTSTGAVGIGTAAPVSALQVVGTVTATAFNPPSDRNLKENFDPVSPREVLEKVVALPISRWNFIGDAATPHVGPMAQDFHTAFGLGTDERHIATVDADGVALAAIQGLNQKLEETRAENADLKQQLVELKQLVQTLVAKH